MITILFRYPTVEHEMGSDTTFIHSMANSIIRDGNAIWILHPSSYFGLYALSYPSALPFILAGGSEASGMPVEGIMLVTGIIFAIAGVLCAYIVAKLIRDDDLFAYLMALLFILAPFLVKDTTWVASSRGYVVALSPFLLLLLIKHMRTRDLRYLVLSLATFIVMAATHRMGTLAILVLIAYIFAIPLHLVTQRLRFSLVSLEKPMRFIIVLSALFAFLGVFYVQFHFPGISGANVVQQYSGGAFFKGSEFHVLLINMAVSFLARVCLLLPLSLVGLVAYVWKRPKESYDKFLLLTILLFLPLLSMRDYIVEFLTLLLVLLAIIGLISIARAFRDRRRTMTFVLAVVIVSSVGFSWTMKDYWRRAYPTDGPIQTSVYDAALYIKEMSWGTTVSNSGLTGGRIAAISRMPNMPLGGASTHGFSAQQLIWGYVKPEELRVRLLDLTTVSLDTDEIYVPVGLPNAEVDWETMLYYSSPLMADYEMDRYDVHFVIADNDIFPMFLSYGVLRISCLFGDDPVSHGDPYKFCTTTSDVLPTNRYITFSNSYLTIWLARGG